MLGDKRETFQLVSGQFVEASKTGNETAVEILGDIELVEQELTRLGGMTPA